MHHAVVNLMNTMLNPCREQRPMVKSVRKNLERYIYNKKITEGQVVPSSVRDYFHSEPKNPNKVNIIFTFI